MTPARLQTWAEHSARLVYMPPRLGKPQPLPELDQISQREWLTGWMQGLLVGTVTGLGLAVLLGWLK